MAQQAIDSIGEKAPSPTTPRPLPTLGMRGGLGKTLLISFLLLAIVPLSLLALLTYHEIQRDTRQKLVASLETVVALKEAHLIDYWGYERELSLLADALDRHADPVAEMAAVQALDPTLTGLVLVDRDTGQVLASTDQAWYVPEVVEPLLSDGRGSSLRQRPREISSRFWPSVIHGTVGSSLPCRVGKHCSGSLPLLMLRGKAVPPIW